MKKTPTFYVKTVIVVIGFLLLLISGILPTTEEYYFSDYNPSISGGQFYKEPTIGFINPLWYVILAASAIVFAIGYFFNKTVNIVLVFVFIPIFTIGIFIATFLATLNLNFVGNSPNTELAYGYLVSIIGTLLVFLATCISVLRKKEAKTDSIDLLDNF